MSPAHKVSTIVTSEASSIYCEKEIEDYLWKVIEEKIHIHPQKGATQKAADALRNIRLESPCERLK